MSEPALQAQVDAARAYEAQFVPALFGEWAPRGADAAQIGAGQRVLDVACGTGVLAREAASRTGPSGSVSGLDPGVGMLAVARELAPTIDWRQGVADSLPFSDRLLADRRVIVERLGAPAAPRSSVMLGAATRTDGVGLHSSRRRIAAARRRRVRSPRRGSGARSTESTSTRAPTWTRTGSTARRRFHAVNSHGPARSPCCGCSRRVPGPIFVWRASRGAGASNGRRRASISRPCPMRNSG